MRYEPSQLKTFEDIRSPSLPSELLHFTSAIQWVRQSIPNYTYLIRSILLTLERAYALTLNMRTKHLIKRITLEQINQGKEDEIGFDACKTSLQDHVTISHRDQSMRLCIYVDESDKIWAGAVTQIPKIYVHICHDLIKTPIISLPLRSLYTNSIKMVNS